MKSLSRLLKDSFPETLVCPKCGSGYAKADGGGVQCMKCGHTAGPTKEAFPTNPPPGMEKGMAPGNLMLQCQECGKKFRKAYDTCPKCGSSDIDLAVNEDWQDRKNLSGMKEQAEPWPYYTFKKGYLWDEHGYKVTPESFASEQEAEEWLLNNNIRATIREASRVEREAEREYGKKQESILQEITRYKGDPFWITAKYPSKCKKCGKEINKGAKAFYYPKGRAIYCDSPDCGQQASREFQAAAEDEDWYMGQYEMRSFKGIINTFGFK